MQLNENEYLKRAAILLFHTNPDKLVTGAYIKIGFFEADDDLKFQDEVHGNLFEQIEKTIDLLFSKYIKSSISYDGLNRVEKYEYPKDAIEKPYLMLFLTRIIRVEFLFRLVFIMTKLYFGMKVNYLITGQLKSF